MSECHNKCPEQTVFDPPAAVYQDYFHPQVVNVVHPVEIIRRHHCVPVPNHQFCYSVKDVFCGGPEVRGKKRGR
ncbi:hypothetical protein DMN77_18505 [Paenibacillus sp. 79R4]|nr:hypothetical protein [Paenibacillus sp. 79R4]